MAATNRKPRRGQYKPYMHYFLFKVAGEKTIRIPVRVKPATEEVLMKRKLADVLAGEEGFAIVCANAQCALREGASAFPHPVYLAEFTDNRAYLCDSLNKFGVPETCVQYQHNQGEFQKQFDSLGKQQLAKMSGVETEVRLYPPQKSAPPEKRRNPDTVTSGTSGGERERKRRTNLGKGAVARARRVGLNLDLARQKRAKKRELV